MAMTGVNPRDAIKGRYNSMCKNIRAKKRTLFFMASKKPDTIFYVLLCEKDTSC